MRRRQKEETKVIKVEVDDKLSDTIDRLRKEVIDPMNKAAKDLRAATAEAKATASKLHRAMEQTAAQRRR